MPPSTRIPAALMITGLVAIFAAGSVQGAPGKTMTEQPVSAGEQRGRRQVPEAFFDQTAELRKDLMSRRVALRAVLAAENPDPARASALAAEIFDLQEKLRRKARQMGLAPRSWCNGLVPFSHPCMTGRPGHHP